MRLLIHLAVHPDGAATIEEIASRFGISRNHLMKVAHHAAQAGYIKGIRGRAGGLQLARSANALNIGEIIRSVEDSRIVECLQESDACCITRACGLRPMLEEAVEAFLTVLDRYSLEDVVLKKPALTRILGLKST